MDEQIVPMNNERFTVPEALFHPNNVGVYQAGIPETITQVNSILLSAIIY
jgi:actin-related protein 6